jgi:UrcA family protein
MNKISISFHSKHVALVALGALVGGFALASHPVMAQTDPEPTQEIIVVTPYVVQEKDVGRTATGIPIKVVSISTGVSYADLDLTTQAGASELQKRVSDTAKAACAKFKAKYPFAKYKTSDRECVKDATMEADAVARAIVAQSGEK